jgi:cytidyltransferase-like protein
MVVITFGTFDVLHIGHINILERAKDLGSRLVVGVSSDNLNFEKKGVILFTLRNNEKKLLSH